MALTPLQKGAATTVALSALALFVAAVNPFGGPFGPNGGGGGSSAVGAATTFTSTQTDGGAAFVAPTGQRVCLNGAGCTHYVQSDGGSIGLVGAEVEAPGGLVGITPSVKSALLGEDLSVQHLLVTANVTTEDALTILGGRLRLVPYEVNANAYIYFDTSTGFYVGNQLNVADGAFLTVDNVSPKRSTETLSIYGAHGATLVPQASVDACTGGRKGQLTAKTGDGRLYACDGTSNGVLATRDTWSSSLNFAAVTARTCSSLTFTAAGAVLDEPIAPGGCGSVFNGDAHMSCFVAITATDTATVRLCCHDNVDCADLPAITFTATAIR